MFCTITEAEEGIVLLCASHNRRRVVLRDDECIAVRQATPISLLNNCQAERRKVEER